MGVVVNAGPGVGGAGAAGYRCGTGASRTGASGEHNRVNTGVWTMAWLRKQQQPKQAKKKRKKGEELGPLGSAQCRSCSRTAVEPPPPRPQQQQQQQHSVKRPVAPPTPPPASPPPATAAAAAAAEQRVRAWTATISAHTKAGRHHAALHLYWRAQAQQADPGGGHGPGLVPNKYTLMSALQACGQARDPEQGRRVHAQAARLGCASDLAVCTCAMVMYARCGHLGRAQRVFQGLPRPDVVAWSAMVAAHVEQGRARAAVRLFERMQLEQQEEGMGVSPNARTVVSALQACGMLAQEESEEQVGVVESGQEQQEVSHRNSSSSSSSSGSGLDKGRAVHAYARRKGLDTDDVYVGCALVSMYGKCGSAGEAQGVFDRTQARHRDSSVVLWTALVGAYVEQGHGERAVEVYVEMRAHGGVQPDGKTFASLLRACGLLADKEPSQQQQVVSGGVDGCVVGIKPAALHKTKCAHAEMVRTSGGGGSRDSAATAAAAFLVGAYGKCGSVADAEAALAGLLPHQRSSAAWTAVMAAYVQQGRADRCVQVYQEMLVEAEEAGAAAAAGADSRTLVTMLQACCILAAEEAEEQAEAAAHLLDAQGGVVRRARSLQLGKVLHAHHQQQQHQHQHTRATAVDAAFVASSLIRMYGKCGSVADARGVLDALPPAAAGCNVVAWTAMVAAYAEHEAEQALLLFAHMVEEAEQGEQGRQAPAPNSWTFVAALQACGAVADREEEDEGQVVKARALQLGKAVHATWRRRRRRRDNDEDDVLFVNNSLIGMYGRCGSCEDARQVFDSMPPATRDVVSWNAMLTAYAARPDAALELYKHMTTTTTTTTPLSEEASRDGASGGGAVQPNEVTLVRVLQACADAGSLDTCRLVHRRLTTTLTSPVVAQALIHAYGRCCSPADAQAVFDALPYPPAVAAWTTLMVAYAGQGAWRTCVRLYDAMTAVSKPDGVALLAVLHACSHAGMVAAGLRYFADQAGVAGVEHYAAVVDLLGRAGHLAAAEHLIVATMSGAEAGERRLGMRPDLAVWLALLSACRVHGDLERGERAFRHATGLAPHHPAAYALMWAVYADAGCWEMAAAVNDRKRKKCGGTSCCEVSQTVTTAAATAAESSELQQQQQQQQQRALGRCWMEVRDEVHAFACADARYCGDARILALISAFSPSSLT